MPRKIYLTSGDSSTGELREFGKRALDESERGEVTILNLTRPTTGERIENAGVLHSYFKNLGASKVNQINPAFSDRQMRKSLKQSDVLYIPGGDTKTLLEYIQERRLKKSLARFKGIIVGNSAGAYALTPEYLRVGHGETEVVLATGIIPIHLKCHYDPNFDYELKRLSHGRDILVLKDPSMITYEDNSKRKGIVDIEGEVWRFFNGQKYRLN